MNETPTPVEKHVRLSAECAERLSRLAQAQAMSEEQIIEKALDILFKLIELFDENAERRGWLFLSQASLQRIWDNEEDAVYDNWKELYGVPTR
jgi:predicted transcriptional regulator